MKKKIVAYGISSDGIGLTAYLEPGSDGKMTSYHMHSGELTYTEKNF